MSSFRPFSPAGRASQMVLSFPVPTAGHRSCRRRELPRSSLLAPVPEAPCRASVAEAEAGGQARVGAAKMPMVAGRGAKLGCPCWAADPSRSNNRNGPTARTRLQEAMEGCRDWGPLEAGAGQQTALLVEEAEEEGCRDLGVVAEGQAEGDRAGTTASERTTGQRGCLLLVAGEAPVAGTECFRGLRWMPCQSWAKAASLPGTAISTPPPWEATVAMHSTCQPCDDRTSPVHMRLAL